MNKKVQILSDLHNEFYGTMNPIPDIVKTDADIIILAGDIDKGVKGVKWAVEQSEKLGKPIVYVPGNHEYYGYDYVQLLAEMRWEALGTDVYLMDNDMDVIEGVRVIGTTLWTDYNADPATSQAKAMQIVGEALNDHFLITYNEKKFTTDIALELHKDSLEFLKEELAVSTTLPTVVVTHHGPSTLCQHKKFPLSPISTGFHSDLGDLVGKADLWVYGHTHSNLDTVVHGTRLVANQFGYAFREEMQDFNPDFIVEV